MRLIRDFKGVVLIEDSLLEDRDLDPEICTMVASGDNPDLMDQDLEMERTSQIVTA